MELLTVEETARILKVAPITVRRYISSGRLAAFRVGRNIRIAPESVEALAGGHITLESGPDAASDVEYRPQEAHTGRIGDTTMYASEYRYNARSLARPAAQEAPGSPALAFSSGDSIWRLMGMGESKGTETDVSSDKKRYLADAALDRRE